MCIYEVEHTIHFNTHIYIMIIYSHGLYHEDRVLEVSYMQSKPFDDLIFKEEDCRTHQRCGSLRSLRMDRGLRAQRPGFHKTEGGSVGKKRPSGEV